MRKFLEVEITKPNLFGFNSSEDYYWYVFGKCVAIAQNNIDLTILSEAIEFSDFIENKYPVKGFNGNWGILLRLLSDDNIESICLLKNELNLFNCQKDLKSSSQNFFSRKTSYISEKYKNFWLLVSGLSQIINNIIELQMFLQGYSSRINDDDYSTYIKKQFSIDKIILNDFKFKEGRNVFTSLFNEFYLTPKEAVDIYLNYVVNNIR
jgi:hypothetical protein